MLDWKVLCVRRVVIVIVIICCLHVGVGVIFTIVCYSYQLVAVPLNISASTFSKPDFIPITFSTPHNENTCHHYPYLVSTSFNYTNNPFGSMTDKFLLAFSRICAAFSVSPLWLCWNFVLNYTWVSTCPCAYHTYTAIYYQT